MTNLSRHLLDSYLNPQYGVKQLVILVCTHDDIVQLDGNVSLDECFHITGYIDEPSPIPVIIYSSHPQKSLKHDNLPSINGLR